MNEESGIVVTLKEPLRSRGWLKSNVIEVVKIRKIKVRDLVGLDFTGAESMKSMVTLISRLSDISEEDILEMNIADWAAVSAAASSMIDSSIKPKGKVFPL